MKKLLVFILVLSFQNAYSQNHEITGGIGYSYYFGDLNTKHSAQAVALVGDFMDVNNFKMSYSLGYRYNFKNRFSIGLNFYHLYISGYDSDNSDAADALPRKRRNLSFQSAVNEGFVDFRIEPFRTEKRWAKDKALLSPYLGAGIGLMSFNPKTFTSSGEEVELQPLGTEGQGLAGYGDKYSRLQPVVPISLGLKFIPKSRIFAISVDMNYNHTFTDYLDDVSTTYANPADFQNAYQISDPAKYALVTELSDRRPPEFVNSPDIRGNKDNNDYFFTGQIKFSYFIGSSSNVFYKCCDF